MKKTIRNRHRHSKSFWILLVSVVLLVTLTIGSTFAYLQKKTQTVTNTFEESRVASEVIETFAANHKSKTNVGVKNTGNTDAYIRAEVIINWMAEDGSVLAQAPVAGTDYTITMSNSQKWFPAGNYYYYSDTVKGGTTTDDLISSITCNSTKTVNNVKYYLSVEILSSAIQANPTTVVTEYWKDIKITNDKLEKK